MRPKLPFAVFESLDEHFLAFEEGLKNAQKCLEIFGNSMHDCQPKIK